MKTFKELYEELFSSALEGNFYKTEEIECDPLQLDCLLNPRKHPLVLQTGKCDCDRKRRRSAQAAARSVLSVKARRAE